MIKYLIKTEIGGTEIRLIYSRSPDKFYVIYGLEQKEYDSIAHAYSQYESCVKHALELTGEFYHD